MRAAGTERGWDNEQHVTITTEEVGGKTQERRVL